MRIFFKEASKIIVCPDIGKDTDEARQLETISPSLPEDFSIFVSMPMYEPETTAKVATETVLETIGTSEG